MRRPLAVIDITDPYIQQLLRPLEDGLEIPIEEDWDWEREIGQELYPYTDAEIGIAVSAATTKRS